MPDVSIILGKRLRLAVFRLEEVGADFLELWHENNLVATYSQWGVTHTHLIQDCESILLAMRAHLQN